MQKNNLKKEQFKKWLISSITILFISVFIILLIGAPYDRGIIFNLTILWTTFGPLFACVLFLIPPFILNTKLPKMKSVKNWQSILFFFFSALIVMIAVYYMMASFIFESLIKSFLPKDQLLTDSFFLLIILLLLIYRISLYFEKISPIKLKIYYSKEKDKIKKTIKNKYPWFKLNVSTDFIGLRYFQRIKNIFFDFLVISYFISILIAFYEVSNKSMFPLFITSRVGIIIAIIIEIWFWYGLVQLRYW